MGRLLVFGDLHGCANTIKQLINRVKPTSEDMLVFLGDYIDRGNKVFETIDYMIKLSMEFDCVFLMGNHENMWIRYLKGHMIERGEEEVFLYNGGTSTVDSYCANLPALIDDIKFDDLPQDHQDFYDSLVVKHEQDGFVFVHAGVRPNVPLDEQSDHDMMWIRETFLQHPTEIVKDKVVVHGHTPMDSYKLSQYNTQTDRKNLDSGCVFGYCLTCIDVRTGVKYTQKMIDARTS